MALFTKKDGLSPPQGAAPAGALQPVEQVSAMKQQGYTNSQIIASLQRDGYSSSQIFDALNQVEMRMGTPIDGSQDLTQQQSTPSPPPLGGGYQDLGSPQQSPMNSLGVPPPRMGGGFSAGIPLQSDSNVEELVESVIDEKWNELVKDLNKVIDWKNSSETKMAQLEQQFTDLKDQFDRLHASLVGKIVEYDKNIQDVGAEIKAMEKVFSKVLPVFTDNVSELSRVTDRIRAMGPKKT